MGIKIGRFEINKKFALLILSALLLIPIVNLIGPDEKLTVYNAAVLLVGRVLIVIMLIAILKQQRKYLNATNNPELNPLRKDLFMLGIIFMLGQLAPIILDFLVVFVTPRVGWMVVLYAFSNLASSFAAVSLIEKIYADRTEVVAVDDSTSDREKI